MQVWGKTNNQSLRCLKADHCTTNHIQTNDVQGQLLRTPSGKSWVRNEQIEFLYKHYSLKNEVSDIWENIQEVQKTEPKKLRL